MTGEQAGQWGLVGMGMHDTSGPVIGEAFEDYGNAPEYVINRFCAYEMVEGDLVRLYLCKQKGGKQVLEYTAIVPLVALAEMGRLCLQIAATVHNKIVWRDMAVETKQ